LSNCEKCEEPEEECYCYKCPDCGSKDTEAYDDGEGYPWNIECKSCGNWWDS